MTVGLCTLELSLPGSHSLKDKRGRIKPLISALRKEFNVSVSEVEAQDFWRSATIGIASVSTDAGYVHGQLEKVVRWIESSQPHIFVTDWKIELL